LREGEQQKPLSREEKPGSSRKRRELNDCSQNGDRLGSGLHVAKSFGDFMRGGTQSNPSGKASWAQRTNGGNEGPGAAVSRGTVNLKGEGLHPRSSPKTSTIEEDRQMGWSVGKEGGEIQKRMPGIFWKETDSQGLSRGSPRSTGEILMGREGIAYMGEQGGRLGYRISGADARGRNVTVGEEVENYRVTDPPKGGGKSAADAGEENR